MFRQIRWTLLAIGLLLLVSGGASIFRTPEYEILYSPNTPIVTCTAASGCFFIYTLEIGNTGRQPQDNVRIRLADRAVRAAILPPSVLNFGVVSRQVVVTQEGDVRIYDLGRMPPQQRVQIALTLRHPVRRDPQPWSEILAGVEASKGAVVRGNPAATLLGRFLYAIFGAGW